MCVCMCYASIRVALFILRHFNPDHPSKSKDVELRGHTDAVMQICWNPTNEFHLASASRDKSLRIWDHRACMFPMRLCMLVFLVPHQPAFLVPQPVNVRRRSLQKQRTLAYNGAPMVIPLLSATRCVRCGGGIYFYMDLHG